MSRSIQFSVFAPVYNEEGNLIDLYQQVKTVMNQMGTWELILINDGSRDNSLAEMKMLCEKYPEVVVVNLKRNYGQAVAMDAGFRQARGQYLISLDADLQNDPADIPAMFTKMQTNNLDIITGWRRKRKDPAWMLIITKSARFLRGIFIGDGMKDSGCTLRIYKREYVQDLELWGEMHRYILALLKWRGAKIDQIEVNHRARLHGVSKYNWKKSLKGLVDLFYIWFWRKYSNRPLHLFGVAGLGLNFLGVLTGIRTIWLFVSGSSLSDSAWLVLTIFFWIMGLQFFFFGVIIDLLIRIHYNASPIENRYSIYEISKKEDKI